MAAQISKQQAKDTVSVRQRQQVEARDAAARRQIERATMSIERRRSLSPSPRCDPLHLFLWLSSTADEHLVG